MQKQRLAAFLIIGILLGLLVSACGVAVGQSQFLAGGGPVVLEPLSSTVSLPSLLGGQAHAAAGVHAMPLGHGLQAAIQAQPQLSAPFHSGECHGDDGYFGSYNSSDD
jgi:hypothetical protein